MPQTDTRAWWDDVQHLRESIERSARRRPIAACVSTRAPRRARWPSAMPAIPSPRVIRTPSTRPTPCRARGASSARAPSGAGASRAATTTGPRAPAPEAPITAPRAVAPAHGGDHRPHRRRADAPAAGRDRPPPPGAARRRARRRQARPARALGRRPGLLPHPRRGDEHVACGHARAQRERGRRPARAPPGRSHSHGDAARYPPGARTPAGAAHEGSPRPRRRPAPRGAPAPRATREWPPAAPKSPPRTSGWRIRAYLM